MYSLNSDKLYCSNVITLLCLSCSLFDTGAERYDKLRQNIGHFIVMEAGITTFRYVQDQNMYEANEYTFYLFPRSFSSIDSKFMCQASCLEFLCQHNFDFNKVRNITCCEK
jgi:hypothetical protein